MTNITELERKIFELDKADEDGGDATRWRLKNRFHEEGLDTTKRDLLGQLEKEVIAYGMYSPHNYSASCLKIPVLMDCQTLCY